KDVNPTCLRKVTQATSNRYRIEDGHWLSKRVGSWPANLSHDVELQTFYFLYDYGDLRIRDVVFEAVCEIILQLMRSKTTGLYLSDQWQRNLSVWADRNGSRELGLLPNIDGQHVFRAYDISSAGTA